MLRGFRIGSYSYSSTWYRGYPILDLKKHGDDIIAYLRQLEEVLIPDFQGSLEALRLVLAARPEVLNHNIETVPRLYHRVRPGAIYARSLELLRQAKDLAPNVRTKSGLMVGLGEAWDEVLATLRDLRAVGCDLVTIGQYLQPSGWHLPVECFYRPEEFAALRDEALRLGFAHVESGPLVRSSYHAHIAVMKTTHAR